MFIRDARYGISVVKLCRILKVSRSGYYAWRNRGISRRNLEDQAILRELVRLHQLYPAMGLDSLHQMVKPKFNCSRKRVWKLMKQGDIHSVRNRAYKRTTNSAHLNPIAQSMSRKGDPYDNAVAENFFSCLKCECVHLRHFATRDSAKTAIFRYIEAFYNTVRPHSGIGWMAPSAYEALFFDKLHKSA